ncbi:MAG: hypothetical protein IT383_01145 [Deltaproteobacteria bacterium]|nr:hypothetical protein [Deltaproteobacteria bacterium]
MSSTRPEKSTTLAAGRPEWTPAMSIFGLIPVISASDVGADVIDRLSAPMFGGLVSLVLLTPGVVPVAYSLVQRRWRAG